MILLLSTRRWTPVMRWAMTVGVANAVSVLAWGLHWPQVLVAVAADVVFFARPLRVYVARTGP